MVAAGRGHHGVVQTLLDAGCDAAATNIEGRTALMEAILAGHYDVITALLRTDCGLNHVDCHGGSAMADAVLKHDTFAVQVTLCC